MATKQRLHADLAEVVARGRARAAASGEMTPPVVGPVQSVFTDEARKILSDWQQDGGYERALVAIAEADPDMALE